MKRGYSKHSLNQNNKMNLVTDWKQKEGVFETPQGKWICRMKEPMQGTTLFNYTTKSQHNTYEEALEAFEGYKK